MKLSVQIFSWIGVVLGALAILGGFTATDVYGNSMVNGSALLGGALFFTQGLLALINNVKGRRINDRQSCI